MNPKVSVVIPAYNAGKYLRETIQCVLDQTYKNIEIIIIDDGSTDDTKDTIINVNNLKYIYQSNSGVSSARNRGIIEAEGELIAFLDADDLWHQKKIELQVAYLNTHSDCILVYNERQPFYDNNVPDLSAVLACNFEVDSDNFYRILHRNNLHCSSVLVRKESLAYSGIFDCNMSAAEDTDLWLRLTKVGKFAISNECLSYIREHSDNTTKSIKFRKNRVYAQSLTLARWSEDPNAKEILCQSLAGNSLAVGYETTQGDESIKYFNIYLSHSAFLKSIRIRIKVTLLTINYFLRSLLK